MQNTKLIQLLKSFNPGEIKMFKDFVNSPFYNKNRNVISLYDYLKKYYPEFKEEKIQEELVFEKLFPGEKYDYFKLKNIISDLLVLGKEYLATIYYKDKTELMDRALLEQLRDRNLDVMFEQLYKSGVKKLNETVVKDEYYFFKYLEYTEELKSFYSPKEPNAHFNLFQDQLDYFLKYSITKMLRLYNIMLHENKQNNYGFDLRMLDEVLDYLKKNKSEDNPTILLYYNIILLEKDNDKKYFFELKKLKEKYDGELSLYDKYMYYLHMAGFCADKFNKEGRTDFMKEHFLLSKENFDKGTMELGKILYMDFLNHVKIALRVDEYEWAEMYINTFKDKLTEEKESTLNFCYGYINYRKGNLDKALELISRTSFPNYLIKLQVKILLLQIYFEKEFYDQALAMIDTFRHFLNREKSIKEDFKKSISEYLKLTNDLIKHKTGIHNKQTDYDSDKLKREIENMKSNLFGIKLWLREQIGGF